MYKKGIEGGPMWTMAVMVFVVISLLVIIYTFFGPGQLFAKSSKPIGDTASGLSYDYDNDGVFDTIDPCPCNPNNEKDAEGKCPPPDPDTCRKNIEDRRKAAK